MEVLTRAVWDCMSLSARAGLLDEALALAGDVLGPGRDLGELLGDLEERLSEADFAPFEERAQAFLVPVLQALCDEEALSGLTLMLRTVRPLVQGLFNGGRQDFEAFTSSALALMQGASQLKPASRELLVLAWAGVVPQLRKLLSERSGTLAASLLNTASRTIGENPALAARIVGDVFASLDKAAFRRAADILTDALLDQRVPLTAWTAGTALRRTKRRLLGAREV